MAPSTTTYAGTAGSANAHRRAFTHKSDHAVWGIPFSAPENSCEVLLPVGVQVGMKAPNHSASDLARYPQWLQDVIGETEESGKAVANHEAWHLFSDGTVQPEQHHALLIGFWPLIEKFPHFLALSLLKCSYGRDPVVNTARSWLTRNIRVEQKHAEWYKDWAQSAGVPLDRLYDGPRPAAATAITDWCWYVCESGELAEAMAATNYAVEGVTGEWTRVIAASEKYKELFTESERRKAMRWIHAHATYDDSHPVEALGIIAGLVGQDPEQATVRRIKNAIQKSYDLYLLSLDKGLDRL